MSLPSLPAFPTLNPAQISAINAVNIPGTNLSAAEISANAANAAGLNALPSAASITAGLTPGGAGLPNLASAFGPLNSAPISIPGLADVQSTITSFQSNIGLHLSVIQAGINDKIKSASLNGTSLPDPNALASSMSANMFAPLTGIGSIISNAVSSGLSAIASEIAKGPFGDPAAAAKSVGAGIADGAASLTSQANSQMSSITAPMKAAAMASTLSGPMGQLPAIQSMMSGMGVAVPNAFAVARNMNNTVEVPSVLPIAPYSDKQFKAAPIGENKTIPKPAPADTNVTQAMTDNVIADYKALDDGVSKFYGGARANTAAQNQVLYDAWINGLMPDGGDARKKANAVYETKPKEDTRTDDEKTLIKVYKDQFAAIEAAPGPYADYTAARIYRAKVQGYGYETLNAAMGHASKYTLSADCQQYLKDKGWF